MAAPTSSSSDPTRTRPGGRFAGVARFVAARLDPKAYLGLHVTVGLGVAALALWLFGALLEEVLDNAAVVRFDVAAMTWVTAASRQPGCASSGSSRGSVTFPRFP